MVLDFIRHPRHIKQVELQRPSLSTILLEDASEMVGTDMENLPSLGLHIRIIQLYTYKYRYKYKYQMVQDFSHQLH